jgi:hypothetical protein
MRGEPEEVAVWDNARLADKAGHQKARYNAGSLLSPTHFRKWFAGTSTGAALMRRFGIKIASIGWKVNGKRTLADRGNADGTDSATK